VCFARGGVGVGATGDPGCAAAVLMRRGAVLAVSVARGPAGAPYEPGLLALREGPLLEAAVRGLPRLPDVLLVNATGRDHPRGAGLALHLGQRLDVPSIGVTHRTLFATGDAPGPGLGDTSPLRLHGVEVGAWLRTRVRARPLAVTPGWRTGLDTAIGIVVAAAGGARTPEPIRQARQAAREARARPRD
jgi:deoxyribonuclease V